MLCWEFPPQVTGGLGIACGEWAAALRDEVRLTVSVPDLGADRGSAYDARYGSATFAQVGAFAGEAWRRASADLVHAHDWLTVPAAAECSRRTGAPVIFHVHSLELERSGSRNGIYQIERAAMRMAARIVTVGHGTAECCRREYRADLDKLRVVPNRTPRDARAESVETVEPEKRVIGIARLVAQKGPLDFVATAAEVLREVPGVRFVVIGEGEERAAMEAAATGRGIREHFDFRGFLERGPMMAELARAAVLCLPSHAEPFGLVALEAAALGVPAVVTECCGVRAVLPSAAVVGVADPVAMAAEVVRLLRDPAARGRRAEAARREAAAASWADAAAEMRAVYREVLATRLPPDRRS
jgi:glycosyltransferase involved in cell wall biosynthesis